ncbi:MAG: hypothetical protein WBV93_16710, partial [Anaerobacillus sp.]
GKSGILDVESSERLQVNGMTKIFLIICISVLQFLIVMMLFINLRWVPFLAVGYAVSLVFLIFNLVKDRRRMEEEEQRDDDRNY